MAEGRIIVCKLFKNLENHCKDGPETDLLHVRWQCMVIGE